MGLKQPSMVLGPSAPQDSAELRGTSAGTQPQTVELSAVDSKGRAVPGAFGRAAAGAGAPDGGRKPKRVRCTLLPAVRLSCIFTLSDMSFSSVSAIS